MWVLDDIKTDYCLKIFSTDDFVEKRFEYAHSRSQNKPRFLSFNIIFILCRNEGII